MPVPSIRHSAGGESVVIKQKIIGGKEREREGSRSVGFRREGNYNTDLRAIDGLSVL